MFGTLVDLPEWKTAMMSVIERSDRLEVGGEWVVEVRVLGRTWRSRSTVEDIDVPTRRFVSRSGPDDGNPTSVGTTKPG